jgi:sortase A
MIRIGIKRSKTEASTQGAANWAAPEGYLISDKKHQARKPLTFLRILGNLLILVGVVMLLAVGGWWGITNWQNQQFEQSFIAGGGVVEPTIDPSLLAQANTTPVAPIPSPTATSVHIAILDPGPQVGQNLIPTPTPVPDNSPPVRLIIPSVKIDSKVVPVTWKMIPKPGGGTKSEWNVADYAVGHHAGTANPGQQGNVVMSAHVDYKGQVFKDLHNVHKGDQVIVQTENGQYIYVITDMVIVQEDGASPDEKLRNAHYMDPTARPTLTLITCYPYGVDDKRFIAIAHPYQPETNQSEYTLR